MEAKPEEPKTTKLALPLPITIWTGQRYQLLVKTRILKIKIDKIYMDTDGQQVMITINMGLFRGKTTAVMPIEDFKRRVLNGGYNELEI